MTAVLVASSGGHLAQLAALKPRLVDHGERTVWITFDTAQSRSLLEHEECQFVHFTSPRDWRGVLSNATGARALLRRLGASSVFSTGSAIALSYLPMAAAMGVRTEYIESAARSSGPSVTGRILARVPGVDVFTQYPAMVGGRWQYKHSVFDGYVEGRSSRPGRVKRVVVTLGTLEYPFPRLVQRLQAILPPDVDVLWQTGPTDVSPWGLSARSSLPERELRAAVEAADVVVSHAGCGSALLALDSNRIPILVPRRRVHREHVDDHQLDVAAELSRRGLAVSRDADDISMNDLVAVAGREVARVADGGAL